MNAGKTLFSQLMDFLPWSTFNRYVTRYSSDKGVQCFRLFAWENCLAEPK